MRKQFLHCHLLSALLLCFGTTASAKVWRVNNNTGVGADFAQFWTAVASTSVLAGDTIYLEGSPIAYTNAVLDKRLVIIGPGYLLSGTGANTGLQANPYDARFGVLYIDSAASGSTLFGISTYIQIDSRTDDLKFIRSSIYIDPWIISANSTANNWVINKCILGGVINYSMENLQITNCLVYYSTLTLQGARNTLLRNNVFATGVATTNAYVANNIFLAGHSLTGSVIKYNLSIQNDLPAGFNNQVNIPSSSIFVGTGSTDGAYQLRAGSPAIGAGEPLNGITPDAGVFGTADPYRLSGIPPIPTIYSLSVPASIPATATSMTITFSTRSNN